MAENHCREEMSTCDFENTGKEKIMMEETQNTEAQLEPNNQYVDFDLGWNKNKRKLTSESRSTKLREKITHKHI